MATDYDALYAEQKDALGTPTKAVIGAVEAFLKQESSVLDLGCGQGRDALYLARLGHRVHGVDLSPHGIADMLGVADHEGLAVTGEVADLTSYRAARAYDLVLIDRTLHMLDEDVREHVFMDMLAHVKVGGYMVVSDERKNISIFADRIAQMSSAWVDGGSSATLLVVQRTAT